VALIPDPKPQASSIKHQASGARSALFLVKHQALPPLFFFIYLFIAKHQARAARFFS
jgi:hypothetical protein